jgi:hypothetical protein
MITLKREKRCGRIHDDSSLAKVQAQRSGPNRLEDDNLEYSLDT